MVIDLKYFSGTGNSYRILNTCKDSFIQNGCNATLSSITNKSNIKNDADLIGFCFPVYAFGIPRICRNYLSTLPKFTKPVNAFVIITAGSPDESGFSVMESTTLMKEKGMNVKYSDVIHMPANWTVSMNPPSKEEAQVIINNGVTKAKEIVQKILDGVVYHHAFNYPSRYSKLGFYKDYYLFKWLGVSYLWQNYRTEETCDSCGLCEKICPTNSIQLINNTPQWLKTCEQCMRCVNYCPKQAIYQKGEGSVKGKNIYYEPTFKPLRHEKNITPREDD